MRDRILIEHGAVTISTKVTGQLNGPTILLSNSLGAGLGMWEPQRKLLNKYYRVIGYDTRGHGQSSSPEGDYSFEDLTADAIAILDYFEVEKVDFIGLSLGGMTGLGLGLNYPNRFNKIVCACARADNPAPFIHSWNDRIAAISSNGLAAIWPETLERWLTEEYIELNPKEIAALKSDFIITTVIGYSGCAAALKSLNYHSRLNEMTVPILYISGANDRGAPPETMHDLWITTPSSSYEGIKDCAHIANLNQTSAFNRAIKKFLEK
jgi:3-oxoadipate enol-lactonase|tara:strand:+ start:704 stop:1501 length:798 start_codon:yes stop_codon:yes gene_type:complete